MGSYIDSTTSSSDIVVKLTLLNDTSRLGFFARHDEVYCSCLELGVNELVEFGNDDNESVASGNQASYLFL